MRGVSKAHPLNETDQHQEPHKNGGPEREPNQTANEQVRRCVVHGFPFSIISAT
jgi:hypothetical protein